MADKKKGKLVLWQRFKKHWVRWSLIGSVGFIIANVAVIELTSQSFFCNSCHSMNVFYDSWEGSSHRDIECVKCHIQPGTQNFLSAKINGLGQVVDDALNRTSTKPSAAVSGFACLRSGCHDLGKLAEKDRAANATPDSRPYLFIHEKHVDQLSLGLEMNCTTCHSHIKGSEHFEVNTNACISCHMIESEHAEASAQKAIATNARVGQSIRSRLHFRARLEQPPGTNLQNGNHTVKPPYECRSCHTPPNKVVEYRGLEIDHRDFVNEATTCGSCHRDVTATPNVIEDSQCISCHEFGVEESLPLEEMHHVHSVGEHKVECFSCHGLTLHGPEAQSVRLERLTCTNCHARQHLVQFDTYASTEHLGIPGANGQEEKITAVSPMLLVHVDCSGCHVQPKTKPDGSAVMVASAKGCDSCHEKGLGEKMIPLWQNTTRKLYEQVQSRYDEIARRLGNEQAENSAALQRAAELLKLVRFDGSWGVHNPEYTQELLMRAQAAVEEAIPPTNSRQGEGR